MEVQFKVRLEKPEPEGVKLSKKNVCIITIDKSEEEGMGNEHQKLLQYFLDQENPTWGMQMLKSVQLGPSIDEEDMVLNDVSYGEAFTHFFAITWKCIFALIPPPNYWGGKGCFVVSLAMIGLVTAIVGEMASLLGCVLGIKESITAITLVALGTSLPDTFASMTAAKTSESADAAIGNVTGSNSVNVFLGLGLPWAIAVTYRNAIPLLLEDGTANPRAGLREYKVPSKGLAFSVFMFLIVAVVCFIILVARRVFIGGELGGPTVSKYTSAVICCSLWVIYIVMSIINAYEDKTGQVIVECPK